MNSVAQAIHYDTLMISLWICAGFAVICWLLSVITKEYSWVDRIWSIAPIVYVGFFAYRAGFADSRLNLMFGLVALWGARLTYNFARKGGYRAGGEDYRWTEVQNRIGMRWFKVLNATFVAPYQNFLLLLISLPAFVAYQYAGRPLSTLDLLAASLFLVFLVGESIADQQQWRFQTTKRRKIAEGKRSEQGVVTTGLFRYSRHPNFFCEQAMWWVFYLFSISASGRWLNGTVTGAVLLTLLFQGSTQLTEELSLRKYPEYASYQKRTSRLLPWFPG